MAREKKSIKKVAAVSMYYNDRIMSTILMHKQIIKQTKPKIIINADDFGYCEERSRGIC